MERLLVLTHRENVAIRIFKPGDLITAGGSPDPEFVILDERVLFEHDAALVEPRIVVSPAWLSRIIDTVALDKSSPMRIFSLHPSDGARGKLLRRSALCLVS
jgi:hypothetical protein